ncbi:MAG: LapA family protein [Nitrospirota bacterium]|nr:LapA family protein [Nitrospirota bacterium]
MKVKWLLALIFLFLAVVFLDQNNVPVPVKVIFGKPFYFRLSLIILVSIGVGALLTLAGIRLRKQINAKRP